MFCRNCGKSIPDGSTFCTSCGARTSSAAPTQRPAPPSRQSYTPQGQQPYSPSPRYGSPTSSGSSPYNRNNPQPTTDRLAVKIVFRIVWGILALIFLYSIISACKSLADNMKYFGLSGTMVFASVVALAPPLIMCIFLIIGAAGCRRGLSNTLTIGMIIGVGLYILVIIVTLVVISSELSYLSSGIIAQLLPSYLLTLLFYLFAAATVIVGLCLMRYPPFKKHRVPGR